MQAPLVMLGHLRPINTSLMGSHTTMQEVNAVTAGSSQEISMHASCNEHSDHRAHLQAYYLLAASSRSRHAGCYLLFALG